MIAKHILQFSEQIEKGLAIGRRFRDGWTSQGFHKVIFWGVGGSAMGGDVLRVLVNSRSNLVFYVHRETAWPRWADSETLVFFSSYSGNSKEVLQAIANAPVPESNMIAVTAGGALRDLALKRNIAMIQIPAGSPPRCALGYLAFSVLPVLERIGQFEVLESEIKEAIRVANRNVRAKAKRLAKALVGKAIHIYGVSGFMEPAALRWRAQFAENAKTLASHYLIPEMLHNEVEGWQCPKDVIKRSAAIFLTDSEDGKDWDKKRKAVARYVRRCGGTVLNVASDGDSSLARLVSLISLGDWVSYELACLNRVDSFRIPTIEALKKIKI